MAKNYSQDDLAQLRAELAALREKISQQDNLIEQQTTRINQLESSKPTTFSTTVDEKPTSRRRMLKKLAAGAALAAASTSVIAGSEPAKAENSGTSPLTQVANSFYGIIAAPVGVNPTAPTNGSFGLIGSGASSVASGISVGVQGNSAAPSGFGVQGNGSGSGGIGVQGNGQGIGVQGSTSFTSGVAVQGLGQTGVQGISDGNTGVAGDGGNNGTKGTGVDGKGNIGVHGLSKASNGAGVLGELIINGPTTGNGVHGYVSAASGGAGVYGDSDTPGTIGVSGRSSQGYGGKFDGGLAPLLLANSNSAGAPTTLNHLKGEFYVDVNGKLYYCTQDGLPGTWGQISPTVFLSKPIRLLGSPNSAYNNTPGAFIKGGVANASYFAVDGQIINDASGGYPGFSDFIPSTATAVFGTVVVFGTNSAGYLTIYPGNANPPAISTVTYGGGGSYTSSAFMVKAAQIPQGRSYQGRTGIGIVAFTDCLISLDIVGYML